ncbi:MAG TPA: protein phosphatase 2C domain-containing protein [Acidimicrobiia bacterium]|nr:protein phosphatase 2C domain-containing protein [Acidimicrobiia bacterium]
MSACPGCGAEVADADHFCEACGYTLGPPAPAPSVAQAVALGPDGSVAPCVDPPTGATTAPILGHCSCGGTFDTDGWCNQCGQRAPNDRDHLVITVTGQLAAVSDKGHHHPRNEDAVALSRTGTRSVLVVCDGVSSATDSDLAAIAAANAARDVLAAAAPPDTSSPAARIEYYSDLISQAAHAANAEAAVAATHVGGQNPPSCTFAVAVVDGALVVAGWVGDSRVYWLGDDGTALQLSVDDSWATEQMKHGLPRDVAEADPRAHSITRWLGADAADPTPSCGSLAAPGAGWALVCSDGLWNYCSGASDLALLVKHSETNDPTVLAGDLVAWANEQGGHDNITAALARVERTDIAETATLSAATIADASSPQTRSS